MQRPEETGQSAIEVAVLFARTDSHYKTLPGCDVYDIERDARTWQGGCPVVAHPPCRAWGRLKAFAKPRPDEKQLAHFAVDMIRKHGGVLEHPASSSLWPAAGLPPPGQVDEYGGFTLEVRQWWWGHKAAKATWFYICGMDRGDLPLPPTWSQITGDENMGLPPDEPTHVVTRSKGRAFRAGQPRHRPELTKKAREETPPALARWLVEVARRCRPPRS